jgi:hypothetical protein
MTDIRITTTGSADKILEDSAVRELGDCLHGPLLRAGKAGYDEARKA